MTPEEYESLGLEQVRLFYGNGKTAEDMFNRFIELKSACCENEKAERGELEKIIRSFLKGWKIP